MVLYAIELVVNQKGEDVIIESDAQSIINMLQRPQQGFDWELHNILTDIMDMARGIPKLSWHYVRRSTNRRARKFRQGMCSVN